MQQCLYRSFIFLSVIGLSSAHAVSLEAIPAGEAKAIEKVSQIISQTLVKSHQAEPGMMKRDAHAKHHGCVRGTFEVSGNLSDALAVGVFAKPQVYPAWIRYSNGSGKSQDDQVGDGRGMAVKLMNVPGDKILTNQKFEQTQDFLMINHPTFFVRNAIDYVEFSEVLAKNGSPVKFFFSGVNPLNWRLHELNVARKIQGKKLSDPLATRYWSMTPYLLGSRAVKFSAKPCSIHGGVPVAKGENALRETMSNHLARKDACFEFMVQFQRDAKTMPVEDPTIEWEESRSPFHKVATLMIEKQSFESEKQMDFCENLSFTPWHSLPEHRPLGGINRTRKTVYEAISNLRHDTNGTLKKEPVGNETFE